MPTASNESRASGANNPTPANPMPPGPGFLGASSAAGVVLRRAFRRRERQRPGGRRRNGRLTWREHESMDVSHDRRIAGPHAPPVALQALEDLDARPAFQPRQDGPAHARGAAHERGVRVHVHHAAVLCGGRRRRGGLRRGETGAADQHADHCRGRQGGGDEAIVHGPPGLRRHHWSNPMPRRAPRGSTRPAPHSSAVASMGLAKRLMARSTAAGLRRPCE